MSCFEDFAHFPPEWCPGCGNFDLLESLKNALCDLGIQPHMIINVVGIGQAAKLGFSLKTNMFDGLHGRALPVALGIKMANPTAKLLAVSGDGCFYAEGGNHLVHNLRRNLEVTILASDNRIYGLTKGQASPTSAADFKTKVHVEGVGAQPLNPTALALASGATFVARTFTGNKAETTEIIKRALQHRGAALVDVMSPCISFNKVNTFAWFKQRATPIPADHDTSDLHAALRLAFHDDERIPVGVLYQVQRPVFGEHLTAMRGEPIARQTPRFTPERVRPLFKDFF